MEERRLENLMKYMEVEDQG